MPRGVRKRYTVFEGTDARTGRPEYSYTIYGCSAEQVSSWTFGTKSTGMRDVIEMLLREAGYERDPYYDAGQQIARGRARRRGG
jgi:hypothetical protein